MTIGERAEDVFYITDDAGPAARRRTRAARLRGAADRGARPARRRATDRAERPPDEPAPRPACGPTRSSGCARCSPARAACAALRHIPLSIGEPRHAPPAIRGRSADSRARRSLGSYPLALGPAAAARGDRALARAPLRRCRRGSVRAGRHGAAGERHARGAVRVRAGGGRRDARVPRRRADAEPVLPDLRGRGAARRRRARVTSTATAASGYLPDLDAVDADDLGALPAAVPLLARQPHRRRDAARHYLRRALELASRHGFVDRRRTSATRRSTSTRRSRRRDCCRSRTRAGNDDVRALRRVPQPVEALERAGPALGLRRRRRALSSRVSASIAPTTAARCRLHTQLASIAGVERRGARASRTVACTARSSRASLADRCARCSTSRCPTGGFYLWPRVPVTTRPSRAGCSSSEHVTGAARLLSRARHRRRQSGQAGACGVAGGVSVDDCVEAARRIVAVRVARRADAISR
ncbi:MAG: hypothetical protein MZV65_53490 [Chromatiales bacterium]|nr:hypothetical protein [Chromatiales bacterium]